PDAAPVMFVVTDRGLEGNTRPPRLPQNSPIVYRAGSAFTRPNAGLNVGLYTNGGLLPAVFTAWRPPLNYPTHRLFTAARSNRQPGSLGGPLNEFSTQSMTAFQPESHSPRTPLDGVNWLASPEQTENACRSYLEALRWPEGISCPQCDGRSITDIPARRRYYCRGCRHFFSLTSGTAFHNSHLPLWKWFLAIELLLGTDGGIPANELT